MKCPYLPGAELVESLKHGTVGGPDIVVGETLVKALDIGGVHTLQELDIFLRVKPEKLYSSSITVTTNKINGLFGSYAI